uniref:Restriction endonuclease HNH n=1 Tax=Clandestinovirus TaxID=2831644 RepID=A0A8F8PMA1_9VIRU|nr:restriction endonuclease HNH [Clandestinovirus]
MSHPLKTCIKCKVTKDLTTFGARKQSVDGHTNICKPCINLQCAARVAKYRLSATTSATCSLCKLTKPACEFAKGNNSTGLRSYCRECSKRLHKEQRSTNANTAKHIPDEKVCPSCDQLKSAEDFSKYKSTKDGLDDQCKLCKRLQYRKRMRVCATIYMEWFTEHGSKCVDCGNDDINVMEADHIHRETKTRNVSYLRVKGSQERFTAELQKCVPRCACCHRIRTAHQLTTQQSVTKASVRRCKEFVDKLKRDIGSCMLCDATVPDGPFGTRSFDFDHIDPKHKIKKIASLVALGRLDAVRKEIEKCRLLCANCHRIHTRKQLHHCYIQNGQLVFADER